MFDEPKNAIHWSRELVKDPALVVRTQAVKNLIRLHARSSSSLLWKEIFNKINFRGKQSLWVRGHMARALAMWAHPGEKSRFLKLMDDSDPKVRKWAAVGLERLNRRSSVPGPF
jgi:hypothetical protein